MFEWFEDYLEFFLIFKCTWVDSDRKGGLSLKGKNLIVKTFGLSQLIYFMQSYEIKEDYIFVCTFSNVL